MITIKHLSARLGDFSLKEIDLDIREGEYFVILGPTGAGKTVLIECLAGLHRLTSGEIWIDGRNVTS
jgi:molybdate transport system ATP-binding protein